MFNLKIQPGDKLNNQTLCSIFFCSPQGGMRKSNATNSLVLISNHVKSIYNDRWEDDTLHYTGMGTSGDQSLDFMQNKTLAESVSNGVAVYLFEVFEDKVYTYIGPVQLSGEPYQETQADESGNSRIVLIFPLKVTSGELPPVDLAAIEAIDVKKKKQASKLSDEELLNRAKNAPKISTKRTVTSKQQSRDVWVAENCKRQANGVCQLCGKEAPFKNSKGEPYLECHHIDLLSEGGADATFNIVAICPNCHRKMHVVKDENDIAFLKIVAIKNADLMR